MASDTAGTVFASSVDPLYQTTALAPGTVATTDDEQLAAMLGTPPYHFAVYSGALPTGVALSASGLLSGTTLSATGTGTGTGIGTSASRSASRPGGASRACRCSSARDRGKEGVGPV